VPPGFLPSWRHFFIPACPLRLRRRAQRIAVSQLRRIFVAARATTVRGAIVAVPSGRILE